MNRAFEIIELLEYVIEASEETGKILPFASIKRSLSDLRQLVQNAELDNEVQKPEEYNSRYQKAERVPTKANTQAAEAEYVKAGIEKRSGVSSGVNGRGLANRIKPIPAEVRGRVRELVDLISDEDQFDDSVETNKM